MEGLLSECNPLLLIHSSCKIAVAGMQGYSTAAGADC